MQAVDLIYIFYFPLGDIFKISFYLAISNSVGVTAMPTFIAYKNGVIFDRFVGADRNRLVQILSSP